MKQVLFAAIALCLTVSVGADDDKTEKKKKGAGRKPVTTCKCAVAGKEIKIADAKVVEYKKGKVYVCCDGCKAKLEADKAKYALKSNAQLVATRQYRQAKCPMSGGKLNKDEKTKVGGVMVKFCCGNCKGKAEKATGDDKLKLVFADKAFDKSFVPVKAKKKTGDAAKKASEKADADK